MDNYLSLSRVNEFLIISPLIDRQFIITCKGIAVHSPLSLSHQCVNFAATALYDHVHFTRVHVINDHVDTNEFRHPVPRIGKGFEI